MCGRSGCERLGVATDARRCPVCGFVTEPWDGDRAARLLAAPASAGAPSRFSPRVGMPVSTANEIPGWEVLDYVGEVFGLVVRSRGAFPQLGASLRAVLGGELTAMTGLLRATREDAINRLIENAQALDADAVIAMRFDVTTMGDTSGWTEVCAYGTAVKARRISLG